MHWKMIDSVRSCYDAKIKLIKSTTGLLIKEETLNKTDRN